MIGADVKGLDLPCEDRPLTTRMALICGTSSCHMAVVVILLIEYSVTQGEKQAALYYRYDTPC